MNMKPRTARRRQQALLLGLALALLAGCTATPELTITQDSAGRGDIDIVLSDFLVSYVRDLSATIGVESDRVFDPAAVRGQFREFPEIDVQRVAVPSAERLEMTITFEDLAAALSAGLSRGDGAAAGAEAPQLLETRRERVNGETQVALRLALTPELLDAVVALSPWDGTLLAEILLPPDRTEMTGADYIEYLVWALEEYEDPRVVREALEAATVDVVIETPGRIVSQRGGEVIEAAGGPGAPTRAVRFRIPVVDLVTLEESRVYQLRYVTR
jgi:hypothetical protein